MTETVSVIIPVYNRERYIEECVRSVLSQTFTNFEILIVDDGSIDGTLDICSRLSRVDNRIRIICGEHRGVSEARNIAIEASKGEYLFLLIAMMLSILLC